MSVPIWSIFFQICCKMSWASTRKLATQRNGTTRQKKRKSNNWSDYIMPVAVNNWKCNLFAKEHKFWPANPTSFRILWSDRHAMQLVCNTVTCSHSYHTLVYHTTNTQKLQTLQLLLLNILTTEHWVPRSVMGVTVDIVTIRRIAQHGNRTKQ